MAECSAQLLCDDVAARRALVRLGLKVPIQLSNDSILARYCVGAVHAGQGVVSFVDGSQAEAVADGRWMVTRRAVPK